MRRDLSATACHAPHDAPVDWSAVETEACNRFVYDDSTYTATVVSEFDLVCDRNHYKSLVASVGSVIYGFGALLCGYISDNYGRKMTILVCTALNIAFHLASTFATSYASYLALYLIAGKDFYFFVILCGV